MILKRKIKQEFISSLAKIIHKKGGSIPHCGQPVKTLKIFVKSIGYTGIPVSNKLLISFKMCTGQFLLASAARIAVGQAQLNAPLMSRNRTVVNSFCAYSLQLVLRVHVSRFLLTTLLKPVMAVTKPFCCLAIHTLRSWRIVSKILPFTFNALIGLWPLAVVYTLGSLPGFLNTVIFAARLLCYY